jgi:hypothetical protein
MNFIIENFINYSCKGFVLEHSLPAGIDERQIKSMKRHCRLRYHFSFFEITQSDNTVLPEISLATLYFCEIPVKPSVRRGGCIKVMGNDNSPSFDTH